ncbi:MAG: nitroreductase family protein [Coriobacteriia bacterium]|nr:nitroreductase family protein [Coriobacteriia bacterium]
MDAMEAIATRRSIRRFTGEPVTEEHVEALLRAAMAAPSAGDQQPWRFVVMLDAGTRSAAAETSPYARMLPDAGLGILVAGELAAERHEGMWVQDCAAAVQNILLAAHALGLGAVWLGYHPRPERERAIAEVLGLPERVVPFAVVAVGHPAEEKPPAERYEPAYVHRERW